MSLKLLYPILCTHVVCTLCVDVYMHTWNHEQPTGVTPLLCACARGHVDIVRMLLEGRSRGLECNVADVHQARVSGVKGGKRKVLCVTT